MEPSLTQLAAMARDDPTSLTQVANFTLRRKDVGSIRWLEPVDVRGLDLGETVRLTPGTVTVSAATALSPSPFLLSPFPPFPSPLPLGPPPSLFPSPSCSRSRSLSASPSPESPPLPLFPLSVRPWREPVDVRGLDLAETVCLTPVTVRASTSPSLFVPPFLSLTPSVLPSLPPASAPPRLPQGSQCTGPSVHCISAMCIESQLSWYSPCEDCCTSKRCLCLLLLRENKFKGLPIRCLGVYASAYGKVSCGVAVNRCTWTMKRSRTLDGA